jgi:hypothetical protein
LGLEKPNLGLDPGETFFPNSVSDLDSAETFQISGNLGVVIDENVCLLDSQPCSQHTLLGVSLQEQTHQPHSTRPSWPARIAKILAKIFK